jgi:glycosyltransferase involved in cell wall biosynthesis
VEAFGQVYIEALASRIPCVFTISGIASQVVIHGENALVVNWRDSGQIFSALKTLLDDKKLRMRLTADRDLHSLKRFSIEVHMEELKKLYMSFAQIKAGEDSLCW